MSQKTLKIEDLQQFTGTEVWHRHPIARKILYTDGAEHVAENGAVVVIDVRGRVRAPVERGGAAADVDVVVDGEGLKADLTFSGRAFPIEEPRFIHRIGPRRRFIG